MKNNAQLSTVNSQLPKGWEIKKLGEVCEIRSGRDYKKIITPNGKYPIFGSAGKAIGYTNEYICEEGTTIIGRKGTINSPIFIDTKFWNVDTAFGFHALDNIDKKYLYLYCLHFDFTELDKGSGRPSLVKKDLLNIQIPIPPLPEQKRIVSILDRAFEAIDKAKANAEQNIKNAKELFESYLQGVFENKGDDWESTNIGRLCELIDSLHQTPTYSDSGYAMVRVTEIKGGELDTSGALRVDEDVYKEFSKRHKSKNGDIIMSRVGASFGVCSYVIDNEPFCLGQNTVFILPKIDSRLVFYFLQSPIAREQMNKLASGAAQPTISLKSIKAIEISLPPIAKQKLITIEIEKIQEYSNSLQKIYQQKLIDLEELKKSVLQKAFNGEL